MSCDLKLGEYIDVDTAGDIQLCEVIGIDELGATVKPFGNNAMTGLGAVARKRGPFEIAPDASWRGRIMNALAEPIDEKGLLIKGPDPAPVDRPPPPPLRRQRVTQPLITGVRVIDLFTPLCAGQRMGIFAGSGVGKSTLLAMLAKSNGFDITVISLVGERSREVRDFIEDALGDKRDKTICVVATGDESPMMRRLAPKTAMAIAEYFRRAGQNVLLIVDSITRYAHACREVALAAGEPPVARGYTPSVFSDLPKLLERAGPGQEGEGSITGIFSVLIDGDDHNDPIADAIRGTLDGHIVLDRHIAQEGRWPAVNLLASTSRLAQNAWSPEQSGLIGAMRAMISRYEDTRDVRLMGGYRSGTDADLDKAIVLVPRIYDVLKQNLDEPLSVDAFQDLANALRQ